ncbi:MAG: 1,4-dihydroxy-6-naphthoate synthase [Prevotellaceae bacterium]|jgi:1,4-dihydroxy-6-naphthoate synthase|nr:1,4-dihydroxy-6-naphthoate synthase [Prevotellaceae bacterium]
MKFTLGFSPCPNDTFIFDALVNGKIAHNLQFDVLTADVEELNRLALTGKIDITKMSVHAYAHVAEEYEICESGSALGRGNGPLFVSRTPIDHSKIPRLKIAVPGQYTTAAFLLKYAFPTIEQTVVYLFSDIENAILNGEVDAGVLIHESRFTYRNKGLQLIADLGKYWETTTCQPIPLGCIAMRKSLPANLRRLFSTALKNSILFARANPDSSSDYVRMHAQEMCEEITTQHIAMFVNDFTLALGEEGRGAIQRVLQEIEKNGGKTV